MALPPTMTEAAPAPAEEVDAPMTEMGDAGGWVPFATIMQNPETGQFKLVAGDEPEDGMEAEGMTFDGGPPLLRALMEKIEGGTGADEAFADGYKDGSASMPPKMPPAPME